MEQINRKGFFSVYRKNFGKLDQGQVNGLTTLLDMMEEDDSIEDPRYAAYMLSTIHHECAQRWEPIIEYGRRNYFLKYEYDRPIGKRLGNTKEGDGYLFRGRGYVQITGRDNYERMNELLDLSGTDRDIVVNPDHVLIPETSYAIMVDGMMHGRFTGKKLSQYIDGKKCDYLHCRRIINSMDRASKLERYAKIFEEALTV